VAVGVGCNPLPLAPHGAIHLPLNRATPWGEELDHAHPALDLAPKRHIQIATDKGEEYEWLTPPTCW
jgi:hypothetical protein